MKAAGILFLTNQDHALFLRRTSTVPDPGCWDFPGGAQEDGETAEETALREAREEIGAVPAGIPILHTRTISSASLAGVAGTGAPSAIPVAVGAPGAAQPVSLPPDAVSQAVPTPPPGVDFTTFLQRVDAEFIPTLNDEHDGWAWAPVSSPPQPLHPGCQIAIDRLAMNELGVARAIAAGQLASPQRYENMWLFAMRITGTDVAFRNKLDEYVLRKPELYLNDEFLARCNGLPVVFKHPTKRILDSDEFSKRIVGTVFLPYIASDEIWAVSKIFVDDVAQMMKEKDLSTSPGVNFADFSVNAKLRLEDGSKVLIEGEPSLFDHVAICELGVWDKDGEPTGIRSEAREDSAMADKDDEKQKDDARKDAGATETEKMDAKRDDAKRKDSDEPKKEEERGDVDEMMKTISDNVRSLVDSVTGLGKRMDAMEKREDSRGDARRRNDAEEDADKEKAKNLIADKAKKDAQCEEDKKADAAKRDDAKRDDAKRDDTKRDDSALDFRSELERVKALIPKDMNDADYHAMSDAQARADEVFADFGKHAPRPLQGESIAAYERRCVRMLKEHSATWKAADVTTAFADDASFGIVRDQVYREARETARSPVNIPDGQLRMREKRQDGHIIREFYGNPRSWMDPMAGAVQMRGTGSFLAPGVSRTH